MKRMKKGLMLLALSGSLMAFGGCIDDLLYQTLLEVVARAIDGFIPDVGTIVG